MRSIAVCASVGAMLFAAGCGGDEEQTSTADTRGTTEATATAKSRSEGRKGAAPQAQSEQNTDDAPQNPVPDTGPTPGSESAAAGVPVTPGGDNSIQLYGVEGEVSGREQASATMRAYLNAFAARLWRRACAQMSSGLKQSVGEPFAGGAGEAPPCPPALRRLTAGAPESARRQAARVGKVLSFRVEGEQAFLIFRSGDTVKYMPMALEAGEWKVGAIEPSEFFLSP